MNNPYFTFPPPPPPPPQASGPGYSQASSGQHGPQDRGRGGGRGRGYGRGGLRGGNASGYGSYPSVNQRQTEGQYGQPNNFGSSYPLPDYPPVQQPQYSAYVHPTYGQSPPPHPHSAPYSGYPANEHRPAQNYGAPTQNQQYGQGPAPPTPRDPRRVSSHGPVAQPIMMPPIRVGRDGRGGILHTQAIQNPPAQFNRGPPVHSPYQDPLPHQYQQNRYDSPNLFQDTRGRGYKRGHPDAFNKPRNLNPSRQAAPAVPSFGNPFSGDMSRRPFQAAAGDNTNKPKKKKRRRHNQLGLTPRTEEHESSEEEDDQDEEMKLAAAVGAASQRLQFTYGGQTSTLQSSSEIAAWIAERKKRFPTKTRAAEAFERKKQSEDSQRAARQAAKESQEKRRAEARERQEKQKAEARERQDKQKATAKQKHDKVSERDTTQKKDRDKEAAALKAKLKVEKLRKRLEKEEKRIAKAEAKASRTDGEACMSTGPSSVPNQMPQDKKRKRTESLSDPESSNMKMEPVIKAEPAASSPAADVGTAHKNPDLSTKEEPKGVTDTTSVSMGIIKHEPDAAPNPLTPTSQPSIPDTDQPSHTLELSADYVLSAASNDRRLIDKSTEEADVSDDDSVSSSLSDDSSETSSSDDDDDSTSSEGSSSSSDDAPETAPSKREGPVRVPPPKRENPKAKAKDICRSFLKNGRCRRGESCRYRHELPEKGSASRPERKVKTSEMKKERKGLYQRVSDAQLQYGSPTVDMKQLVDQEKEQEDQQVLAAIVQLGEQGLLAPPPEHATAGAN